MGNWKVELGKMAVYVCLPVIIFHGFHLRYAKELASSEHSIYPRSNPEDVIAIANVIKDSRKKREEETEEEKNRRHLKTKAARTYSYFNKHAAKAERAVKTAKPANEAHATNAAAAENAADVSKATES